MVIEIPHRVELRPPMQLQGAQPRPLLTAASIRTNLVGMINVNIHEAKTSLSALVRAVEERGETVIIQRHGKPVAEIHAYSSRGDAAGFTRDLTPAPELMPRLAEGYDPAEPLAADEWPPELR
jgi:prevent-host-death family protein